jgi:hypothetical protein
MMYSSLHEASFFTCMDDGYDASQYGYRVFIPASPNRTNVGGVVTSNNVVRQSSTSAQQYQSFYRNPNGHGNTRTMINHNDDYSQCMNTIDPSSLDILSSPEVRAILETQQDWDTHRTDPKQDDDPYLSDCEEMEDSWYNSNHCPMSMASLDELPAIDEKKM